MQSDAHGWLGSGFEQLNTAGPLTGSTADGGSPEHAFNLVLPSMPTFNLSERQTERFMKSLVTGRRS